MSNKVTRLNRASQFRSRLKDAMAQARISQSVLARMSGADRSTLSQLLRDDGARLPSAHLVARCAEALGVSADWLLSLSDRPETTAELLRNSLSLSQAPRAMIDEQIFEWHREAAGYKIRHVPMRLPDMLKTDAVLAWEYGPHLGRTTQQAINAARDRLDWMQSSRSDYEIAFPIFEMESLANGTGYYAGLPEAERTGQLAHLDRLCTALYPRLRVSLFDARRLYSAPITIFGPLLAVIYTGGHYMAFRDVERVETFTADFDTLVREASITTRALPDHMRALRP